MTDREMLELAAKAAGIDAWWTNEYGGCFLRQQSCPVIWNPLTDDGDALRLAVKLKLSPKIDENQVFICVSDDIAVSVGVGFCGGCLFEATRRAIVRAAAEIGRNMG